jgi:hypothetical protein
MNVTGVEWRGRDPREGRFSASDRKRRARPPTGPIEDDEEHELENEPKTGEDSVRFHTEPEEESADEVDLAESQRSD